MKKNDTITPLCLWPPNSEALPFSRSNRTGGGIGLIYNKCTDVKKDTVYSYKSEECANFHINHQHKDTKFAVIYRPLDTSIISFITDLTDCLDRNINKWLLHWSSPWWLSQSCQQRRQSQHHHFQWFPGQCGINKLVSFPTYILDNILDLTLSHKTSNTITGVKQERLVSDHHQVHFNITNEQSSMGKKVCSYRKLKKIDINQFKEDIKWAWSNTDLESLDASSSSFLYSNMLRETLDQHASLKTKTVSDHSKLPWFSDDIAAAIWQRRKAERKWKQDISNTDLYLNFYQLRRLVLNLIDAGEHAYYIEALQDTNAGTKQIFKTCDNLLGCNKDLPWPPGTNEELASTFNNFFIENIAKIRELLLQNQPSSDYTQPTPYWHHEH